MSKPKVYLLSEETLKDRTILNANVDTKFINQTIWDCQETHVQELVGTDLYVRLLTGVDQNNLTSDESELLDDYLTNVMLFRVLSEIPMVLSYKFLNKGVLKKTAENAESASMSELADIMKHYQNKAEFYEQRTIKYLQETILNDQTKFTEYQKCEAFKMNGKRRGYRSTISLAPTRRQIAQRMNDIMLPSSGNQKYCYPGCNCGNCY